jgi:hypothetical protein
MKKKQVKIGGVLRMEILRYLNTAAFSCVHVYNIVLAKLYTSADEDMTWSTRHKCEVEMSRE